MQIKLRVLESGPTGYFLSTFRMNTCKSVSKQRTLTTFRMNTCAKTGGGVGQELDPSALLSHFRIATNLSGLRIGFLGMSTCPVSAFTKHLQGGRYSELRRERCIMLKTYAHEPIGQILVSV